MEKVWKDIPGYENIYQVNNFGEVRSYDKYVPCKNGRKFFSKSRILKLGTHKRGYKTIMLHKDGKVKLWLVHRLVALVFIPNPNNYEQVNHKDEDKTNNRVDNLEWCDNWYNSHYGTRIFRCNCLRKKERI